jgi:DNA repair protein RadC
MRYLPIARFVMVRERGPEYDSRPFMTDGRRAAAIFRSYLMPGCEEPAVEHFVVAALSIKHRVLSLHTVGVGCLSSTIVHPREVFAHAIAERAAGIIACHNHPSGDPTPSPDDIALTKRLADGGALLGIPVLDHLILGDESHVSLKERGVI